MARLANGVLLLSIYAGWALAAWFHQSLPFWMLIPIGAVLLAWHGSFQHEAVHEHLAARRWLNDLLIILPIGLWLPFPIYRKTHRAHHHFDILTDPHRDPESFYVDQTTWPALPRIIRKILIWHNTLLGRMLLGPVLAIGQFVYCEVRALLSKDWQHLRAWTWHLAGVAVVLTWVLGVCAMPLWKYLLFFVLPGTSLTLVRSFAEHKAAHTPFERTAIVEAGPFFSLLFLNNNLHFAHHRRPDLPWHALPAYYRSHRNVLLEENGHLHYRDGYREIAGKFLTRPVDNPVHPFL